jgi:uncharacterized membrane protein (UPF0127 family)
MMTEVAKPMRIRLFALCLISLYWIPLGTGNAAEPSNLLAEFGQSRGIIETSRNLCLMLDLYLADTPQQHGQGLMYIRQLGEYEGMLFRHSKSVRLTMWMKNTYVALDMAFIRSDGSIAGIEPNTEPLSMRRITSPEAVAGVLELNAGFTDRWNIQAGNRLLAIN